MQIGRCSNIFVDLDMIYVLYEHLYNQYPKQEALQPKSNQNAVRPELMILSWGNQYPLMFINCLPQVRPNKKCLW